MKYILTFIDDNTRINCIFLLKSKDQTFESFRQYKAWIEKRTNREIHKLKSDRGGEYSSSEFLKCLRDMGIEVERGPAYRPQANSVAERFNRTLLGKMRSQLYQSGLPLFLWGEAAMYTSLQINLSPTKALDFKCPVDVFKSQINTHIHPFDIDRLKPFGCLALAHDRDPSTKVSPVAKRFIFVGLEHNARAARLWDKGSRKVMITGDVKYMEDLFPAFDKDQSPNITNSTLFHISSPTLSANVEPLTTVTTNANQNPDITSLSDIIDNSSDLGEEVIPDDFPSRTLDYEFQTIPESRFTVELPMTESPAVPTPLMPPRKSTRQVKPPDRYGFTDAANAAVDHDNPTYANAMNGPDASLWKAAMADELDSLVQHAVGTLVEPPPDANVIGGMWVFHRPRDAQHRIIKYKACWVAFGNHQIPGLDYDDTYASVGKVDSLRILLALSVNKRSKLKVRQFDVKTAFLNGDIKDRVYVRQVRDFEHPTQPHRVWQLDKALYGTKQAARRWQQHLNDTVAEFGLYPTESDTAVYVFNDDSRGYLVLHIHVDDSLVFFDNDSLFDSVRSFIDQKYELKWTDTPILYLGIKLHIQLNCINISQPHYIETTLIRFGMINCNSTQTPLPAKAILHPGTDTEIELARDIPYQELVGCLQWLSSTTCPDISYAVAILARFNSAWTLDHWGYAKHVLRYLKGSLNRGITYDDENHDQPWYFSDSDFSQCQTTRRSITGYTIHLGGGQYRGDLNDRRSWPYPPRKLNTWRRLRHQNIWHG